MSAIAGINGDVWLTTSPSTALGAPETANDQGNHINYFAATHQFWDPTVAIVVQNSPNGSTGWVTVTDYVFYYPVGEIVFNTVRTNTFTRINTGNFFIATALDGPHNWKLNLKGATKDVTPFQAAGSWMQNLAIMKNATGSVDAYRQDGRLLTELNDAGSNTLIGCQFWWNETGGFRWQFYAMPTGIQQMIDVQDVDKQMINFQIYGPMYYITSNALSSSTVTLE